MVVIIIDILTENGIYNHTTHAYIDGWQEYGAHVISTIPTVPYIFEYSDGRYLFSRL